MTAGPEKERAREAKERMRALDEVVRPNFEQSLIRTVNHGLVGEAVVGNGPGTANSEFRRTEVAEHDVFCGPIWSRINR